MQRDHSLTAPARVRAPRRARADGQGPPHLSDDQAEGLGQDSVEGRGLGGARRRVPAHAAGRRERGGHGAAGRGRAPPLVERPSQTAEKSKYELALKDGGSIVTEIIDKTKRVEMFKMLNLMIRQTHYNIFLKPFLICKKLFIKLIQVAKRLMAQIYVGITRVLVQMIMSVLVTSFVGTVAKTFLKASTAAENPIPAMKTI